MEKSIQLLAISVIFFLIGSAIYLKKQSPENNVIVGQQKITPQDRKNQTNEKLYQSIDTLDAQKLINKHQSDQNFAIIDIRTKEEFEDGHLAGAINIDYYQDSFIDQINKLDKEAIYLIYCRSGKRSAEALKILKASHFQTVYELTGGYQSWLES
jgi:phage shock protein E